MMLVDKHSYLRLAADFPVVPVARRIPADTETPVSTYLKTARGRWSFLLESVEGGTRWGRYSLVGFDPFVIFELRGGEALVWERPSGRRRGEPLAELRKVLRDHRSPRLPQLPRFSGGLVGYLGYGVARLFERLPESREDPAGLPDARLFAPGKILAFDNVRKTLDVVVLTRPDGDPPAAYRNACREIEEILRALRRPLAEDVVFPGSSRAPEVEPTVTREHFEGMVARAREAIHAGEAIQVVLSQAFEGESALDPFTAYRALRAINPSPYLFHVALDEEVLVGASPEVMVRVEEGRGLLRPIAGTRPRGATPSEDARLEGELLADEKERAEHVMLVDLGRNDLGRVARAGGVRVEESFGVERYSHVMHLVSTVSAELREDVDGVDVLAAAFPAGTVSGAPKVRAMELIAELEPRGRGVYAGAVGYLGFDGNVDTCIAIRTLIFRRGRVYLQAGAGIVADSDPAREYEETLHKAQALRRALEVASRGLSLGDGAVGAESRPQKAEIGPQPTNQGRVPCF